MVKITVKESAYEKYSLTTWQGEVEINGEIITYRFSEDNNGAELFILTDDNWESANVDEETGNENHKILYSSILMLGNPEELGDDGETAEIEEDELEDWI